MNRISVPVASQSDPGGSRSGAAGRWLAPANRRSWIAALAVLLFSAAGARAQYNFGSQPVGSVSGQQSVTVTSPSGGTVSSVEVLTLGAPGTTNPLLDFQRGTGFSCASQVLAANGTCQQSVTFDPVSPGLRIGAVVLLDSSNAVLGTEYIYGTGTGGLAVLVPGNVLPVAGQDGLFQGPVGNGKAATSAELYLPSSVTMDGAGNLYIADSDHNQIRMVCASANPASATIKGTYANCTGAGIIVTIAGNGDGTYTGDNGAAANATLSNPSGVTLDGAGNLYIADTFNNVIRVINANTGIITTIAGNGTPCGGKTDSVGDGCAANQAVLNGPKGVTLDRAGNLYIADTSDQRIRMVAATSGIVTANSIITTVAGNGDPNPSGDGTGTYSGDNGPAIDAGLSDPYTVAFDAAGNMYIPDSANNRVRMVAALGGAITTASKITTFAGNGNQGYTGDGTAANLADLWAPSGVAVDAAGNVFIADTQNAAIRKVSSTSSATPGIITTLAKNASGDFYYNGTFVKMLFYGPTGLYLDGSGNLYVADTINMVIREIVGNSVVLDFLTPPVRQGSQSAPQDQTVENDGNAPLDLTAVTPLTNAAVVDTSIADPCPNSGGTLTVAEDCAIGAVFAPTVAGNPLIGNIDVGKSGDTVNSPLDIELIGDATAVNSTSVVVSSNIDPSGYGQKVTLTATVQTGSGTGNLTGTVTFLNNNAPIPGASNLALSPTTTSGTTESATATFPTTTLPVGANSITATYNVTGTPGDPAHFTSKSPPYIQNVDEATTTTLTPNPNPSTVGQNVMFTATVAIFGGGGVTPDGTVTLYDGPNAIGSQTLTATGVVTFNISTLSQGPHSIYAQYSGGVVNPDVQQSKSSPPVNQVVQAGTSIVITSGAPNPSNYGQQVTFTAVVTPTGTGPATGTVKFYFGTTPIGTATILGTTNQASLPYSNLPVGSDMITADYLGDSNNGPSNSVAVIQQVTKTQTSTSVSATPQPNGIAGGSVVITAKVQVVSGSASVTGTVSFTSNGAPLGAPATVNPATGIASITLTNVSPATYSIVAIYSGDNNDDTSTSTPAYPYTVVQATTQTAVTVTPSPALVGQPVTFTAKVTGNGGVPTGTVIFEANGTAIGAPATLNAGTATLTNSGLVAGTYTITAIYSGDADDTTSTGTATAQLIVGTIPTTTTLASASTTGTTPQVVLVAAVLNAEQVTGGATPTPTGTVTFKSGTTVIGSSTLDSNGVATLPLNLPAGTYTIVAVYRGDQYHSGSTSQPVTISTTATNFNLSVTPGSVSMAAKQNYTVQVTLTSVGGFSDTIGLGCASLPANVSCHFSTFSVPLAANGTSTAQLTIDTNNPLTGGSTAMNSHSDGRRAVLAGLFLPFSLFFGGVFWRFRRRNRRFLTVVLVLVLSAAAMLATGCGGFSTSSTKPGTYVIQVTGTGVNSGVIHYQNVTLTIT